jgi:hypothetical protein
MIFYNHIPKENGWQKKKFQRLEHSIGMVLTWDIPSTNADQAYLNPKILN